MQNDVSTTAVERSAPSWSGVWLDVAAFAGGLAIAWWAHWETTDLVWSLWLSSLVVGYVLIVWTLTASAREFTINAARDTAPEAKWLKAGAGGLIGVGLLFGLAFFTVHFGGFHYVHSVFLSRFFPIITDDSAIQGFPRLTTYVEVLRRYWMFLPVAFLAEREAFRRNSLASANAVVSAEVMGRRRQTGAGNMMTPYKNVVRMHLLIFFFVAAHFMKFENFLVYAVVYAVYFFPWRLLKRAAS